MLVLIATFLVSVILAAQYSPGNFRDIGGMGALVFFCPVGLVFAQDSGDVRKDVFVLLRLFRIVCAAFVGAFVGWLLGGKQPIVH